MKSSLLVLAAGMGSRYGGLKQMDSFGPNGETIIDYSIYDAIKAGFDKVVFVIREHFKKDFEEFFKQKFEDKIEIAFVTQELDKIPEGLNFHPEREKPWGTAHAVMMGRDVIEGPFAVINADDYYGTDAYKVIIEYFNTLDQNQPDDYAVVAYKLSKTLSKHGTVNRGICYSDALGNLDHVVECVKISESDEGVISYPGEDGARKILQQDDLVSMNMWAFQPSFFKHTEDMFKEFLANEGMELKSEFYIPKAVDNLIRKGTSKVKVLQSDSEWFGVTYQEDKPIVIEKLNTLIQKKVYPADLWDRIPTH
jgi:dTDP-glucose pyrophosphorylase